MTKEEIEAKKGEEGKVPEGIKEAIEEFHRASETIFKCFDDIYSNYLRGRDVREELKGLRDVKSDLFHLIGYILSSKKEGIEKIIEGKGITEEKRAKILEFKERYRDLEDEMDVIRYEEIGFINPPTDFSFSFIFDEELKSPLIELKILSGRKEILHSKVPPSFVYGLVGSLQTTVKECLTEMKEENIVDFEIEGVKELAIDAQKEAKGILDIVEGMEKRR
jgi:hypothetical protein